MKNPKSKTISFRLPIDATKDIEDRCEQTKQSVGEYVRTLTLDSLYERETAALTEALGCMNETTCELNELLAMQQVALRRLAFALLTREGPMRKDDALAVIAQIFRTE